MFSPLLFRPRSRPVAKPLKERLAPGNTGRLDQYLRNKSRQCQSAVVNQCWNTSGIQDPPTAMPPVPCSWFPCCGPSAPFSVHALEWPAPRPSARPSGAHATVVGELMVEDKARTRPPGWRPGKEAHSVASAQMKAPQQASPGTSTLGFPSPNGQLCGKTCRLPVLSWCHRSDLTPCPCCNALLLRRPCVGSSAMLPQPLLTSICHFPQSITRASVAALRRRLDIAYSADAAVVFPPQSIDAISRPRPSTHVLMSAQAIDSACSFTLPGCC